jgi:alpha-glucoside transport system permease protein
MNREHLNRILGGIPKHLVIISLVLLWIVPTIGLLVTSLRPVQDVNSSGWWTVFSPQAAAGEYGQYCGECHGAEGNLIPEADLSNPEVANRYRRSAQILVMLRREEPGGPHAEVPPPSPQEAANIAEQIQALAGVGAAQAQTGRFTINNYVDALVGYRGTTTYLQDCEDGQDSTYSCTARDFLNPRGMGRAFLNSLFVTIPASILPILFAAFAGYAFAWMDFRGRYALFAILVGLQVVPLQMTLVPISRLYAQLGLNGSFLGVWLFHTGFGMPYAIYLMRNFLGTLPRDLFESAYLDGASHWTAFRRLVIPLAMPAIASLGIFQFLWVWNDLLVALVFLGGANPVMTYQISNMVTSLGGGWQLLTAAAFLSIILPMIVFFSLQRFFVRGMLAGAVKG